MSLEGFTAATDDEFAAQVEQLMELPLEQRLAGLADAEQALRDRLGSSAENTSADVQAENAPTEE
ncbi:MAG: Uncharacterised protein [Cellulomonadaceae bacterium TMED98]|nr:MAG: Uncharacterised protein [Cellulomonadaceae bacterium TMED98]|tara:strand:+ start:613 stop:807 length:195 start_codon:yes stop_codon:yes gene_type:complete